MTLTACEVTAAEAPFDRVSKTIPHPLSWGAALWSVVSVRWATVALLLFLAGLVAQLNGAPEAMWWTLYLACYLAGGWGSAWAGAQALRNKALDVDLLMIAAAVGAVAIGQIFDGALLIVIFATSGALDDIATRHTAESVKGLLDLAPDQAVVVQGDGSERVVAAIAAVAAVPAASAAPPCSSGPAARVASAPTAWEPVALEATAGCFLATAVLAPAASSAEVAPAAGPSCSATVVPAGQPYPRVALGVAAMPGSSMATAAPAAAEPGGHRAPTAGPAARPGCSATAGKAAMAARWAATAATVATPS